MGAHVTPRSCRPFERAARIRSVPATCSLGSAWPFQGAPQGQVAQCPCSPQYGCRWCPLSSLPGSILELPPDVPTGGTSWGSSHHTCSWKERGEGREHRAGSFSLQAETHLLRNQDGENRVENACRRALHRTLGSAGPGSLASCVPHRLKAASEGNLLQPQAAACPGITWVNRWAATAVWVVLTSGPPSPDDPSHRWRNGAQGMVVGLRRGARWPDHQGLAARGTCQ